MGTPVTPDRLVAIHDVELSDGELGLLTLALVDLIPRIQRFESITTGETVNTDQLLLKLIELRRQNLVADDIPFEKRRP